MAPGGRSLDFDLRPDCLNCEPCLQLQPWGKLKTSGGKSGSVFPWRIRFFKDSTRLIFFVS